MSSTGMKQKILTALPFLLLGLFLLPLLLRHNGNRDSNADKRGGKWDSETERFLAFYKRLPQAEKLKWKEERDMFLRRSRAMRGATCGACHPSGKLVAVGFPDGRIVFYSTTSNPQALPGILKGNWAAVQALAFHPSGNHMVSVGEDSRMYLWRLRNARWELFKTYRKHNFLITSLAFSPTGKCLASGGLDEHLGLWPWANNRLYDPVLFGKEGDFVTSLVFLENGKMLAASVGRTIALIRINGTNPGTRRSLTRAPAILRNLAYQPSLGLLAALCGDHSVAVWNRHGRLHQLLALGKRRLASSVFCDTRLMVTEEDTIHVLGFRAGRFQPLPPIQETSGRVLIPCRKGKAVFAAHAEGLSRLTEHSAQ